MIGPNSPLGTPGFFDQAVMPTFGGILPGTLPQDMPVNLAAITPKVQEDDIKSVMADFMNSMAEVQLGFSAFLGTPLPNAAPAANPAKPK